MVEERVFRAERDAEYASEKKASEERKKHGKEKTLRNRSRRKFFVRSVGEFLAKVLTEKCTSGTDVLVV